MDEARRTEAFHKDIGQEERLRGVNALLGPLEEETVRSFDGPTHPVVFLVGVPRSGTTVVAQALAACGTFAYPDNFVARFWQAPYVGMQIGHALGIGADEAAGFDSTIGSTPGWSGPHEFGYFWRRWFAFADTHKVSPERLSDVDVALFRGELGAMEAVRDRPLFFKNLTCGMQIEWLAKVLPRSRFVLVTREPLFNMQSILQARTSVHGDPDTWWSLRPPETTRLVKQDRYVQVAGQVHYTLEEVQRAAATLDADRFMSLSYESFCADPRSSVERIAGLAGQRREAMRGAMARVPVSFHCSNVPRLPAEELQRLEEAFRSIANTNAG